MPPTISGTFDSNVLEPSNDFKITLEACSINLLVLSRLFTE